MSLTTLCRQLAEAFDGPEPIEEIARQALLAAKPPDPDPATCVPLAAPFRTILAAPDAHPVCAAIAQTPLPWAPPQTSDNPAYVEHSLPKVHVELIGPDGFCPSDTLRLGLYGMLPKADYGIRTHPAEEIFVMLAGEAFWLRGDAPYLRATPGGRSYHPSMLPHANRTGGLAFMSLYVWHGDVATDNYTYQGIPQT